MRKYKKALPIRYKITALLLVMVTAALLVTGGVSALALQSMRRISTENNRELGQTAAADAEEALESMAGEQLFLTAVEKAAYIEEKFAETEAYVKGIADLAEKIYENPQAYPKRDTPLPERESTELAAQLLRSAKLENPTQTQLDEIQMLGNIQDLLVQYTQNNNMVSSAYLATRSGWMIQADYIPYSKYTRGGEEPDFYEAGERQWYQRALLTEMGETVYSDVIVDIHQGKDCIVCSQPVYLKGEIVAVAGVGSYLDTVQEAVLQTSIGETGYAFLVNQEGRITISPKTEGETKAAPAWQSTGEREEAQDLRRSENLRLAEAAEDMVTGGSGVERLDLDGREVYLAYAPLERLGWSFVTVMDVAEVTEPALGIEEQILQLTEEVALRQERALQNALLCFCLIMGAAAAVMFPAGMLFAKRLTEPVRRLTKEVARIDGDKLDYRIHIATGDEIEDLGDAFNRMTAKLGEYVRTLAAVTAEKERIRTEIQVASRLQADMLPDPKAAFPGRRDFLLNASMTPAKGVGGDFYDFFLTDENHLALVMADVSGKGVPAALFMVVSRTLIRSRITACRGEMKEGGLAAAVQEINESLCANNKNNMFVTAWIGVLSLATGVLRFVNAGHCYPIVLGRDGLCTYEKEEGGFVLAGLEDSQYREGQLQLRRGDMLFLYTDGVTEATDVSGNLYGEARLLQTAGAGAAVPEELLQKVWADVQVFQGEAEQFDDTTMLALKYRGSNYLEKTGAPKTEDIGAFADFVEDMLCAYSICEETAVKIKIAFDEIFSNICYYSRAQQVTVGIEILEKENGNRQVILSFEDDGIAYNLLEKPEPDFNEIREKGKPGGLGIYLVKNQMDCMEYEYSDGKNKLKLIKTERKEPHRR